MLDCVVEVFESGEVVAHRLVDLAFCDIDCLVVIDSEEDLREIVEGLLVLLRFEVDLAQMKLAVDVILL